MSLDQKSLNKIIRTHTGNHDAIRAEVLACALRTSELLPLFGRLRSYFDVTELREKVKFIMENEEPGAWLKDVSQARVLIPDEELRERLISIHKSSPWSFYIYSKYFFDLFPNEFFKNLLRSGRNFLLDDSLRPIFQLYNSAYGLESFPPDLKELIENMIEDTTLAQVRIVEPGDPGFGCGGMDRNFYEAVNRREGVCVINGQLIAKRFHVKGEEKAKKVTYVSKNTVRTKDGCVLWKNFVYAPSEGQHQVVIDAITRGDMDIQLDDVSLKPIRPTIGLDTQRLFDILKK